MSKLRTPMKSGRFARPAAQTAAVAVCGSRLVQRAPTERYGDDDGDAKDADHKTGGPRLPLRSCFKSRRAAIKQSERKGFDTAIKHGAVAMMGAEKPRTANPPLRGAPAPGFHPVLPSAHFRSSRFFSKDEPIPLPIAP